MPAPATDASVVREGGALRFGGALVRAAVPALWRTAAAQAGGARCIDIGGVTAIDSAGLALLSALAHAAGRDAEVVGAPPGLPELRAAYRLDAALGFAA